MSDSPHNRALELLGMDIGENSPEKISERLSRSGQDPKSLADILPKKMVLIGPILVQNDYEEKLRENSMLPLDFESIRIAREICLNHFETLINSHGFMRLRAHLESIIQQGDVDAGAPAPELPASSIDSIKTYPLMAGTMEPYIPLVRVEIADADKKQLLAETLGWGDILFCSMGLIKAVSHHVAGSKELISAQKVRLHPQMDLAGILNEIKTHAQNIEQNLMEKVAPRGNANSE